MTSPVPPNDRAASFAQRFSASHDVSPVTLPADLASLLAELLDVLPPDRAMRALVVTAPQSARASAVVSSLMTQPRISSHPELIAALWLYVDELDKSHVESQAIDTPTGSYWHGIMHRREGDFDNSHYWFDRVGKHHPALLLEQIDPHELIDRAREAHTSGAIDETLIKAQQHQWWSLFAWCATNTPSH
jgi:hypothetical protein